MTAHDTVVQRDDDPPARRPSVVLVHGALTAAVMAHAQRGIDPAALGQTFTGTATWRSLPSWALIATAALIDAAVSAVAGRTAHAA